MITKFKTFLFFLATMLAMFLVTSGTQAQDQKNEKPKVEAAQKETNSAEKKPGESKTGKPNESAASETAADQPQKMLLDVTMKDIDGNEVNLKKYHGKVVMVVNVASKCGFTGQYKPLQSLYEKYSGHGFEIVCFPCNQFGKQEPGDDPAINSFCKKKFGIEFDLFSKVDVKGEKQALLFKRLTEAELEPAGKGDIHWNFEKFLIGKNGQPIARYRSNVAPDHEIVIKKINAALEIVEESKSDSPKKNTTPKKAAEKKSKDKPSSKPGDKKTSTPNVDKPRDANPEKKSNDS